MHECECRDRIVEVFEDRVGTDEIKGTGRFSKVEFGALAMDEVRDAIELIERAEARSKFRHGD